MDETIKNGERWKQPRFPFFEATTQWLTDDQWVLMSAPFTSKHGWPAVMPTSNRDGKIFYTAAELLERLERSCYERVACEQNAAREEQP